MGERDLRRRLSVKAQGKIPQRERLRQTVSVSLSDAARLRLAELADIHALSRSSLVEGLIMGAKMPPKRRDQ